MKAQLRDPRKPGRAFALIVLAFIATFLAAPFPAAAAVSSSEAVQRPSALPPSYALNLPKMVYQTMNNCGPATLSMIFAYYGVDQSQQFIGEILRPFQDPTGKNDDKSVSMSEMLAYAESSGFAAFHRVNGDLATLKAFVSANIPVIVQTLLEPNDDVGHFRIVTGYSDAQQRIIQTDPYRGTDLKNLSYDVFQTMWQPYGYEYLVIVPKDKVGLVASILGDQSTEAASWQGLLQRSRQEQVANASGNPYPVFNESKAYYHLGQYPEAKAAYESVASQLPPKTLWYQLEPIQTYQKLGEGAKVLAITNRILNNGNRAYPELYYIQAQVYLREGNIPAAKDRLNLALYYNRNYQRAENLLASLGSLVTSSTG